jgi:hypothetical protein
MISPDSSNRPRPYSSLTSISPGLLPVTLLLACGSASALDRTWIGGNADWADGGSTANWNPADEPDADDTAIFNTANGVNLGSNNTVLALTMSAGIDLFTAKFDLTVDGLVQLSGSSTNLFVGDANSLLLADAITINSLADLELDGGTIQVIEETGNGVLDINVGGELAGHGVVSMTDALAGTTTLIVNDGLIAARRAPLIIFGAPQVGTLAINATDADARIDLDGAAEAGAVTVSRNQTLDINLPLSDIFNGSMVMAQDSVLDSSSAWILGAFAIIDIDNGAVASIPAVPAGTSTIAGSSFSQNSGTINVVDADGTLQFNAPFTMNGGALVNNGLVVFNSSTTIGAAANFSMPATTSSLTVAANRTVTINQANFNLDGSNAATNVIALDNNAVLTINTGDYDTDSATNAFDGTVNLANATIDISVSDAEFVMDGTLNSSASVSDQSLWTGDALDIGNDAGVLDADVNIAGSQPTQFGSQVDFNSDADVDIAAGATAHFLSLVNFNSVNGGNNAEFTGSGETIFSAGVNFSEATHLNMAGGTVDLDGADSVGDTLNIDSPLTITAELMRSFGKANGGGGTNLLDINNSVNTGLLTVNLDNADDEWTLNSQGVMNLVNDNTDATLLAGSDVNINGTVNVTGDVRTTARFDIAGIVNINTAGQPLRLAGGTTNDHNTIAGSMISGTGILGADTARALHGFGTINTSIDFDGTANLRADDGTLTVNGPIGDVNIIGTDDEDGVLNIPAAWNNNVAAAISMLGGSLQGGTITNDTGNGIQGFGLVTARVINNSKLLGGNGGGTLLFETAGNDNDWDGTTDTGELIANTGALLELRDVGAAFVFGGTVSASPGGRVFTNGFALDFNPGSTLFLASGTYESTNSTDLGGTVTVNAGGTSRIKVQNNRFLSFEPTSVTTLNQNLILENNNIIIEAGATFAGTGALRVPHGSHMVMEPLSNANVLLDLGGALRVANSEAIGQATVKDFQQAASSELYMEIAGSALNQFDRLTVSGLAVVDGYLNLDIDGGFVPVLGQTFNIISASGGVTGNFSAIETSGLPAGLAFKINYLPTIVQVEVIAGSQFEEWIHLFTSLTDPADRLRTADPDGDGLNNLMEFAFDGDPTSGANDRKVVAKIASVGGADALTLTFPVRYKNTAIDTPDPDFRVVGLTDPILHYRVYATDDLVTFPLVVSLVEGADAAAIQAGLPPLSAGWSYATCRSPGPVEGDPREFMRIGISEGPL